MRQRPEGPEGPEGTGKCSDLGDVSIKPREFDGIFTNGGDLITNTCQTNDEDIMGYDRMDHQPAWSKMEDLTTSQICIQLSETRISPRSNASGLV